MNTFLKAMDLTYVSKTFWTDSSTVLSWLRRGLQWSRFVWNRIEEIKSLTEVHDWRHVPGVLNPADLPSRGCTIAQLITSKWWEGPPWLRQKEAEWPQEKFDVNEELVSSEISKASLKSLKKRSPNAICYTIAACTNVTPEKDAIPWYLVRFSDYNKVVRMVAWIIRFMGNIRMKKDKRNLQQQISVEEFDFAEKSIMKIAQTESFIGTNDSRLKELNVFLDELGLIRTKTVISNRIDDFGFRYPVVLDPKHEFSKRLIRHTHTTLSHAGINTTIGCLRETVWILSCRRAVRSIINKCVICRRYIAKTLEAPAASLPMNRVREAQVFEVVGIDYAGPLLLKDGQKAWVCIYTCAVYRAVHFELVTTLSTNGSLNTLRRFIARRGRPSTIYSDNGTNFAGANRMLKAVDWKSIASYCTTVKIEWRFNPPSAAWWGGWWADGGELNTVLHDCESVVNARPITCVSDDKEGLMALTPEMFLKEIHEDGVPDIDLIEEKSLNKRLKYQQRLRRELRVRFRSEYLGQLRRRAQSNRPFTAIKNGDIVLIASDNQKRLDWPLARVIELIPGNDGVSRIARLKTATGELVRPLQRLIV